MAAARKLTKSVVDNAEPGDARYVVWDAELKGFGLRVEPTGTKTYLVRYRTGGGGNTPKRYVTIGRHGVLTPDQARRSARAVLGSVANGADPAGDQAKRSSRPTLNAVIDAFMHLHVEPKLKARTAAAYREALRVHVQPEYGKRVAEDLKKIDVATLHAKLRDKKVIANRVVDYLSAMFTWGAENGLLPEGTNPTRGVERYTEEKRERYLSVVELDRLGAAIREAETVGVPWSVDAVNEGRATAKHTPKERRQTPISPQAAAAIRLLLFTGARLREVLHLKWEWLDIERAALFLPDSKSGKKVVYLNAPSLAVFESLPRIGSYVFPGDGASDRPRCDLRRPWNGIRKMAGLENVRLHDLRHTHASFGVGGGLGLPVIAKLLGHAQIRTTERYSHLDADPIRRASEAIGRRISDAMGEVDPARRPQPCLK